MFLAQSIKFTVSFASILSLTLAWVWPDSLDKLTIVQSRRRTDVAGILIKWFKWLCDVYLTINKGGSRVLFIKTFIEEKKRCLCVPFSNSCLFLQNSIAAEPDGWLNMWTSPFFFSSHCIVGTLELMWLGFRLFLSLDNDFPESRSLFKTRPNHSLFLFHFTSTFADDKFKTLEKAECYSDKIHYCSDN